jgi:hypothetical protein
MLGVLDAEGIERVLTSEVLGRIGCRARGRVYVVPVTYAYDGEHVYVHSGEGTKVEAMRADPSVCFEVEHVRAISSWESVIAWGTFEELSGADAARAMALLEARLMPLMTWEASRFWHAPGTPGSTPEGRGPAGSVVYRIRLTEKTGRFERP